MKRILTILILLILSVSCSVQKQSLEVVKSWSYPLSQFDSTISLSYVDHTLEKAGNERGERWANRKDIHVISIKLVNNTNEPIHGTQISFLLNGKETELVSNKWLAKKIRQKASPLSLLLIPATIFESIFYNKVFESIFYNKVFEQEDENGFHDYSNDYNYETFSGQIADDYRNDRKTSNNDLKSELISMELARQILWPNQSVYCIIGIKSEDEIADLKVQVKESGFSIVE